VHHLLPVINDRLKCLKPPGIIKRMTRSTDERPLWKCFEYELFGVYYSLPILLGILPEDFWNHHCKFVSAISLLLQESISHEQIHVADDLLDSYVADFEMQYGLRNMTMNVHCLRHYCEAVRDLGPLLFVIMHS